MKAAIRNRYGGPEVLDLIELPDPIPGPQELLIQNHFNTVNRTDCGILWGLPLVFRFFTGLFKPRHQIPGSDFAGEVLAIGERVTQFNVGDRVFGFHDEGLPTQASKIVIKQDGHLESIPKGVSYEDAVASAEGAHYALNFINKVQLDTSKKVMVNGGTGAIGSAAIQLLKHSGLEVTATAPTAHLKAVKELGADRVIDYQKEDFTKDNNRYDLVFDAVGKSSFGACKKIMKPKAIYISSELGPNNENPFLALLAPLSRGRKVKFPVPVKVDRSLRLMSEHLANGTFKPLIDRVYPYTEIKEAYAYTRSGQKIGNVLLKWPEDD